MRCGCVALVLVCLLSTAASAQPTAPGEQPAVSGGSQSALRTFVIEKPTVASERKTKRPPRNLTFRAPKAHDSLRTTMGVGYVQGADWGAEFMGVGGFAGTQVQFQALVTKGQEGLVVDNGGISIFDPDRRWRAEAGDLFSSLRGASRGARLSWQPGAGRRRPAIAVYRPGRRSQDHRTVLSYRDQIHIGEQTLLDAEIASDRAFALRSRWRTARFEMEMFYRSTPKPVAASDASLSAGVTLWRGLGVRGGVFRSLQSGQPNEWRTIAVRLPLTRFFNLTLERAHASTPETSHTTSAAMGSLTAGSLRLFHRHQQGDYDLTGPGFAGTIERQQTQSFASYNAGPRVNVMLQLATQRSDNGRVQHWEEMQTTLRLTSSTTLRAVTAIPDVRNAERWRAYFRQELPSGFAVQADYGRLAAYQSVPSELDRSRLKLMLFKTVDVATPARGAQVSGRVVDHAGRGVAGAAVKLGPFTTETDPAGAYRFAHVPAGEYELSLDRHLLPADIAWDGRRQGFTLAGRGRVQADLQVTPLNAIHGRVYCDRNGNGRFDAGEAVAGAVLHLGDQLTATDQNGAYSFYNVWPGAYVIRLNTEKLLPRFIGSDVTELMVTLGDDSPVTGADFRVLEAAKPIIWTKPSK